MTQQAFPEKKIPEVFLIFLFFLFSCNHKNKDETTLFLFPQVKVIISTHCTVTCHAPGKGFYEGLPVILESDSDIENRAAGILSAVAGPVTIVNKRMPPAGMLSSADIDIITRWLDKGGKITD